MIPNLSNPEVKLLLRSLERQERELRRQFFLSRKDSEIGELLRGTEELLSNIKQQCLLEEGWHYYHGTLTPPEDLPQGYGEGWFDD